MGQAGPLAKLYAVTFQGMNTLMSGYLWCDPERGDFGFSYDLTSRFLYKVADIFHYNFSAQYDFSCYWKFLLFHCKKQNTLKMFFSQRNSHPLHIDIQLKNSTYYTNNIPYPATTFSRPAESPLCTSTMSRSTLCIYETVRWYGHN